VKDEEIKRTLRELQKALTDRNEISEDQINQLKQLRVDIEDFLAHQSNEHGTRKDLAEYVLGMETRFTIDHPILSSLFRETLNSLNRIGV